MAPEKPARYDERVPDANAIEGKRSLSRRYLKWRVGRLIPNHYVCL